MKLEGKSMFYSENSGHQLLSIATKTCIFQNVLFFPYMLLWLWVIFKLLMLIFKAVCEISMTYL